jgi:predicted ester cyclase
VGRREQDLGAPLLGGASHERSRAARRTARPDFVDHTLLPGQDPSRQGYLRAIVEDHAALSDIGTTIEYQATDGDDIVITRHTAHSIHDRGALLGMEPTGKEWKLTHIDMHRI